MNCSNPWQTCSFHLCTHNLRGAQGQRVQEHTTLITEPSSHVDLHFYCYVCMCSKCMYTCMASRPLLFGVTVTLYVHEGSKLLNEGNPQGKPHSVLFCCYILPQYPGDSPHTISQIGNVKVPRPCTNSLLRNNTYIEVWCRLTWLFQNNSIMYHVLLPRQSCSVYLCFSVAIEVAGISSENKPYHIKC